MKIRLEYRSDENDEVVIHCKEMNDEVQSIMAFINQKNKKIVGGKNKEIHLLDPSDIFYCESVDQSVFVYTIDDVYHVTQNLMELEEAFSESGFFRCSKTTVINLNMVQSLKSEMGNRINAKMKNGEHVIISRHFAKLLRDRLRQ